jgi:hypothetical protein
MERAGSMKHHRGLILLALAFLLFGDAPYARAGDEKPKDAAELVGAVVKSLQDAAGPAFPKAYRALEARIQMAGADGESAARALLGRQAEITSGPTIHKLLDKLAGEKKPVLAAQLLLHIAKARRIVALYKKGHVAVGRVVVEDGKLDPELVLAQMPILPEGYFAGEVGDLERPLCFRAHGYASLEVPLKGKSGAVVDLGTIKLKPLLKSQAGTLKGKVALDCATPTLRIRMVVGPPNTPHEGYSMRGRWPAPVTVAVAKNGAFVVPGLAAADYELIIEAKGKAAARKPITIVAGQTLDVGTINVAQK